MLKQWLKEISLPICNKLNDAIKDLEEPIFALEQVHYYYCDHFKLHRCK